MPDNSTIRAALIAALVAALVAAGVAAVVAQNYAESLKLCEKVTLQGNIPIKDYILANQCTGDWKEAK